MSCWIPPLVRGIGQCRLQSELLDPSISEGHRAVLEGRVQQWKGFIQESNASIAQLNSQMAELVEEGAAISGKGEPPGCHALPPCPPSVSVLNFA